MSAQLQSKIDELQEELESTRTNVDKLYKNQKDMAALTTQKPTQSATDDKKQAAEVDTDKLVRDVVAALAKQECFMAGGKSTKAPTRTTDKLWRRWKFYCYTCGYNLTHPTRKCSRKHKQDCHDDHLDATYEDLQGGNVDRNHLWMQWFNPVTRRPCAKRGSD